MTSILKTDEIQSQNGGSVVKMQTLKHPSASGNNLELGSDGSTTITNGTLSAGTLGSSVVVPASIGGGEVLLNTYTADNSSNIIAITGMSTTYTTYKFVVTGLKAVTDSIYVYWFLKKADGTVRSSGYKGGHQRHYDSGTVDGATDTSYRNTLFGIDSDLSNARTYNGVFYVFDPASSSLFTQGTGIWNYSNGAYNINVNGGSHYPTEEAHTSINLQTESGNWLAGTVKMYGIK
jgi:hypothetical protein